MIVAPMCGVTVLALFGDGRDSGDSNILAPSPSFTHHSFVLKPDSDVTAGAVQVLASQEDPINNGDNWAAVGGGPIDVSAGGTDILVELTGVYTFLKLTVTSDITDGFLDATYLGSH